MLRLLLLILNLTIFFTLLLNEMTRLGNISGRLNNPKV